MTEYIVLLLGDAERWWTDTTEEQRQEACAAHARFSTALVERGHTITGGAELHRPSEARTVHPDGTTITDGPYAESHEQVGGYYLVETEDLDDLLEVCKILAVTGDIVEVRRTVAMAPAGGAS